MSRDQPDLDLDRLLDWLAEGHVGYLRLRVGTTEVVWSRQASRPGTPPAAPEPPSTGSTAVPDGPPVTAPPAPAPPAPTAPPGSAPAANGHATGEQRAVPAEAVEAGEAHVDVVAPMVGIFHHAPAPGAPPYVEAGQQVTATTTVGLVESMKVFTAVPAGVAGTVETVLVANGRPVEKGEPLVRVRRPSPRTSAGSDDRVAGGVG